MFIKYTLVLIKFSLEKHLPLRGSRDEYPVSGKPNCAAP